ncbi:helix-turn-helix domain-containing protein [Halobacterium sp. KA-6]
MTKLPMDQFTKWQLEVFQLACEKGYYEYPRERQPVI